MYRCVQGGRKKQATYQPPSETSIDTTTGMKFRLPTEAEWEYASRAGTTSARYWGKRIGRNHANCLRCGSNWDGKNTASVRSFDPNTYGLYDMLGNVWEWTCSKYKKPYDRSEIKCSDNAERYVLRGGSWVELPVELRSSKRGLSNTKMRYYGYGFRLAMDAP